MNITTNKVKCKYCDDVLVCEDTYQKLYCTCGKLIVTGGKKGLLRFKFNKNNDLVDAIENIDYIEESDFLIEG